MVKRGRVKYVPYNVIEELEKIKIEKGIKRDVVAFNDLLLHARVGREVEHIRGFWFFTKPKRKKHRS